VEIFAIKIPINILLKKIGRLRVPWSVNGGGSGHDFSPLRKSDRHIIEHRSIYQEESELWLWQQKNRELAG